MTVDILLTVYNGLPFLEEQMGSLQAQTHQDWRLWVRNDGSTDETAEAVMAASARDARIQLVPAPGDQRGVCGGFAWLLDRVGSRADYVMFCDADDSWLPNKIELTLQEMQRAEAQAGPGVPVLVHTDLTVVDAELKVVHDSFWAYQAIDARADSPDQLCIRNTVTGCTAMINPALQELSRSIPSEAIMHDWWIALLASCFGRIIPVSKPTILYRQHGRNAVGAKQTRTGRAYLAHRIVGAYTRAGKRQSALGALNRQAEALLRQHGGQMSARTRALVEGAVEHLHVRAAVANHQRTKRLQPILQEVASGRYRRLANGLSSAARDLLI